MKRWLVFGCGKENDNFGFSLDLGSCANVVLLFGCRAEQRLFFVCWHSVSGRAAPLAKWFKLNWWRRLTRAFGIAIDSYWFKFVVICCCVASSTLIALSLDLEYNYRHISCIVIASSDGKKKYKIPNCECTTTLDNCCVFNRNFHEQYTTHTPFKR